MINKTHFSKIWFSSHDPLSMLNLGSPRVLSKHKYSLGWDDEDFMQTTSFWLNQQSIIKTTMAYRHDSSFQLRNLTQDYWKSRKGRRSVFVCKWIIHKCTLLVQQTTSVQPTSGFAMHLPSGMPCFAYLPCGVTSVYFNIICNLDIRHKRVWG